MRKRLSRFILETKSKPTLERILFIILLHAIAPSIFIIFYLNLGQRETAVRTFENNLIQIAHFVSNAYEEEFLKTQSTLSLMAQLPDIQSGNTYQCNRIAQTIWSSDHNKSYSNIGAVSAAGDNFCNALPLVTPINISQRPNFITTKETKNFTVGAYQISTINKKAIIVASYPILDENNEFAGLTFASIDLMWLNKLAEKVKLPPNYTLTVLDRNVNIIARHPDSERWVGQNNRETPLGRAILNAGDEGIFTAACLDGIKRIYAYTKLQSASGDDQLYITIGVPQTEIVTIANQNLYRDSIILLTVIVTAVFICAFDLHFILFRFKKDEVKT